MNGEFTVRPAASVGDPGDGACIDYKVAMPELQHAPHSGKRAADSDEVARHSAVGSGDSLVDSRQCRLQCCNPAGSREALPEAGEGTGATDAGGEARTATSGERHTKPRQRRLLNWSESHAPKAVGGRLDSGGDEAQRCAGAETEPGRPHARGPGGAGRCAAAVWGCCNERFPTPAITVVASEFLRWVPLWCTMTATCLHAGQPDRNSLAA